MRKQAWLQNYQSLDGVALTLSRVARRSPRTSAIENSMDDLTDHYDELEQHFLDFYPDARSYAATLLCQDTYSS